MVSLIDLPKTILSAAGYDTAPLGLQGRPLSETEEPDWGGGCLYSDQRELCGPRTAHKPV